MRKLNNTGSDHPVLARELKRLTSLGAVALHNVVHQLRVMGHPTCSSNRGYWVGTREEVLNSAYSLEQRANSIYEGGRRAPQMREPDDRQAAATAADGDVLMGCPTRCEGSRREATVLY